MAKEEKKFPSVTCFICKRMMVSLLEQLFLDQRLGTSNSLSQHCRLGLGFNQIKSVENGSLASTPNIREIHLDNNRLRKVPPGLSSLRYLQVRHKHKQPQYSTY